MTAARYHELATAIAALEAEGISVSAHNLHAKLGGSYPRLLADLRQFRRLVAAVAAPPPADVVVEAPVEARPLPDPGPWVPPRCPLCEVPVLWMLRDGVLTCSTCATQVRRVVDEEEG